jgi:hypothetical protein
MGDEKNKKILTISFLSDVFVKSRVMKKIKKF